MASKVLINYPVGQDQYDIPFPYLARPFVVVTLVNSLDPSINKTLVVGSGYRFVTATVIEILEPTDGFDIVRIQRYTSSTRIVDFKDGSPLVANDLNVAEIQSIHIAEEGRDYVIDLTDEAATVATKAAEDSQKYRDEAEGFKNESEGFKNDIKGDANTVFNYKEAAWEAMLRAEIAASTANATQIVRIDDIASHIPGGTTGQADISTALNAALVLYAGTGTTLLGTKTSRYRQDDTIIAQSGVTLDYNGAWVDDNVQSSIPTSGGRPGHTFQIYGVYRFKLRNFVYNMLPTRKVQPDTDSPQPTVMWIGGQYLGDATTRNIEISGIDGESGTPLTGGFQMCGMGELNGLWYHDCNWANNGWRWGCNFEYGLMPESPMTNPNFENGRHPYNLLIERVNGRNIRTCEGFWRSASCFNVSFRDCFSFNVSNAIHYFSGDRGITRYNQKVTFSNMSCRNTNLGRPDNIVWAIVTNQDGSTGEVLPSWTNQHHNLAFINCEFCQEGRDGSSCMRLVGNLGKTLVANCTIKGGFFGLWQQGSGRANYDAKNSLLVMNTEFIQNYQSLRIVDTTGSMIIHSSFTDQQYSATFGATAAVALSGTSNFKMFGCNLNHSTAAGSMDCPLMSLVGTNSNLYLHANDFIVYSGKTAIVGASDLSPVYGSANTCNGKIIVDGHRIIGEVGASSTPVVPTVTSNVVSFNQSAVFNVNSAIVVNAITGGREGDKITFRGRVGGAGITLMNTAVTGNTRIITKSGTDLVVTGNSASVTLMKFSDGWVEM